LTIRPYSEQDLSRIQAIHRRQGLAYELPDLDDPIFFSKTVLEHEGEVIMAVAARMTAEVYLLVDPEAGTPAERWVRFQKLHRAVETDVLRHGLDDAHCWLPPELSKSFAKRLARLGWVRDDKWTPFCKYLVEEPTRRASWDEAVAANAS
jgi:hypothetical protein